MTILRLQDRITYGPVFSRRLGRSLGVNLLPAENTAPADRIPGSLS